MANSYDVKMKAYNIIELPFFRVSIVHRPRYRGSSSFTVLIADSYSSATSATVSHVWHSFCPKFMASQCFWRVDLRRCSGWIPDKDLIVARIKPIFRLISTNVTTGLGRKARHTALSAWSNECIKITSHAEVTDPVNCYIAYQTLVFL
jgi:hypothetical protein